MNSQTSKVAQNIRLQEWAYMIQECKSRPTGMAIDVWCAQHNITKCDYYYHIRAVQKTCIEAVPTFLILCICFAAENRTGLKGLFGRRMDFFSCTNGLKRENLYGNVMKKRCEIFPLNNFGKPSRTLIIRFLSKKYLI